MMNSTNADASVQEAVKESLIVTYLRGQLSELSCNPERTLRNLVDMGCHFSCGGFQKRFLEIAQSVLENERSMYYLWVRDLSANVDHENLIRFGMNIGYHSLTRGVKEIRRIEAEQHYSVPWFLTVKVRTDTLRQEEDAYRSLLEQCGALGIHTWFVYADDHPEELISLMQSAPDHAFVLFLKPAALTPLFVQGIQNCRNVMLLLEYSPDLSEFCTELRRKRVLYGIYKPYQAQEAAAIAEGELMAEIERLCPVMAVFVSDTVPQQGKPSGLGDYALRSRTGNTCHVPTVDFFSDICAVNRIASENDCFAVFDEDGYFSDGRQEPAGRTENFKSMPLAEILRRHFSN